MTAIAYIRKSVVHAGARTLSWEVQEAEVRALATRHGDDLTILSDWGKSGRKGAAGRPGYAELLEHLEAGSVHAIYAYSLSRLSRSLVEYARFADTCMKAGVPVRLVKEGEIDFGSASGRLIVNILAAVAQMEAELAQERAVDMVRQRRARGDKVGRQAYGELPGENLSDVTDAYEIAGSLHGAARLLNMRGIPTRLGRPWWRTSVRSVLAHSAPHLLPPSSEQGVAVRSPSRLARILRCYCGAILTPHSPRGDVRYYCGAASGSSDHSRPKSVAESIILPWVIDQVDALEPPLAPVEAARAPEIEDLTTRKARLGKAYLAGALEDDEFEAAIREVDAALAILTTSDRLERLGPVNWESDPKDINALLRALLVDVQLDETMRPVGANWRAGTPSARA